MAGPPCSPAIKHAQSPPNPPPFKTLDPTNPSPRRKYTASPYPPPTTPPAPSGTLLQLFCPLHHLNPHHNSCSGNGYNSTKGLKLHLVNYHAPKECDAKDLNKGLRERLSKERWDAVKAVFGLEAVNAGPVGYWRLVEAAMGLRMGEGMSFMQSPKPPKRRVALDATLYEEQSIVVEDGAHAPGLTGGLVRSHSEPLLPIEQPETPRRRPPLNPVTPIHALEQLQLASPPPTGQKLHQREEDPDQPPAQRHQQRPATTCQSTNDLTPLVTAASHLGAAKIEDLIIAEINKLVAADAAISVAESSRARHIGELSALVKALSDERASTLTSASPNVVVRPRWLFEDALLQLQMIALDLNETRGKRPSEGWLNNVAERVKRVHEQLEKGGWKGPDELDSPHDEGEDSDAEVGIQRVAAWNARQANGENEEILHINDGEGNGKEQ